MYRNGNGGCGMKAGVNAFSTLGSGSALAWSDVEWMPSLLIYGSGCIYAPPNNSLLCFAFTQVFL